MSARAMTPPLVCLPVWVFFTFPLDSSAEDKESFLPSSSKASTSSSKISNKSSVEVVDFAVDASTVEEIVEVNVDVERVVDKIGAKDVVFVVVVEEEVVEVVVDTGKTDGTNPLASLSALHSA